MPYKVYGGLRFFERAEIKDALAYLRLIANRRDDASFERVVNLPTRGIGAKSLDIIREQAKSAGVLALGCRRRLQAQRAWAPRPPPPCTASWRSSSAWRAKSQGRALHEQVDHVLQASGLIDHHKREKADRGEARVENLEELVSAARGFEPEGRRGLPPLQAFLAHAVLESGEGQAEAWEDCVQMMTLHSAKGLEFPVVFMCGMEDGLFPHQRSLNDLDGLEEERRLCYVGMTRAHAAAVSHLRRAAPPARQRQLRAALALHQGNPRGADRRSAAARAALAAGAPWDASAAASRSRRSPGVRLGARVRHGKFGEGVILTVEGNGAHARVQVNFEKQGTKWLMLQYANLEPMH